MAKLDHVIEQGIRRAAEEEGADPAEALAYAERESGFNPLAKNSKTIFGLYQMRGPLRQRYGSGDSVDPYEQAKAWIAFQRDNKAEMAGVLGRQPTASEAYLGHNFGGVRGARLISGYDPETPVDQVFSAEERRLNPHIDRAGTTGALASSLISDMDKRQAKFGGGEQMDFAPLVNGQSATATPAPLDFSAHVTAR